MISNHVTCFILFYSIGWTSLLLVFFSCFPSFPSESSLASQNAFSLVWLRHGSSSWTTLVYIFFDFIYGGGVLFVFWSAGRSLLPLPPSPSLPWLSLSPYPGKGLALSLSCIPWSDSCLSGCAPCAPAPLRSISLALTVLSWAGETQQKGKQLFRKWEMGFPQFIFCIFLSTCLFLNSVWFVHTPSKTEKRESGAFLLFASFLWAYLWFVFFSSWDTWKAHSYLCFPCKDKSLKTHGFMPPLQRGKLAPRLRQAASFLSSGTKVPSFGHAQPAQYHPNEALIAICRSSDPKSEAQKWLHSVPAPRWVPPSAAPLAEGSSPRSLGVLTWGWTPSCRGAESCPPCRELWVSLGSVAVVLCPSPSWCWVLAAPVAPRGVSAVGLQWWISPTLQVSLSLSFSPSGDSQLYF